MRFPIILLIATLVSAFAAAATLPNGDFESGLEGWQALAAGGGKAAISTDSPAAGRGCLQMTNTAGGHVWALGPTLPGQPGDLLQLDFSVRRGTGEAVLLMSLVPDAAALAQVPLWEGVLPQDPQWHKVSLLLKVPPMPGNAPARIAFGVAGAAGTWSIDAVDVLPGKLPALAPVAVTGQPVQVETLPDGWQPEGLLDARVKDIAGQKELLLDLNGIELGLLPEFACTRGVRDGMVLYAVNRADRDKDLIIKVVGPEGVESPEWTVPVRGKQNDPNKRAWAGTTRFHVALQSLRQGEFWVKLVAKSGDEEKAAPVKVTCRPSYPVMGATWRDAVEPGALQSVRQAGADFHVLQSAPDSAAARAMVAAIGGQGQATVAPLLRQLPPTQYLPLATRLFGDVQAPFWMAPPDDAELASLSILPRLIMELRKAQPGAMYVSSPLTLSRDWEKGLLHPDKQSLLTAERTAGLASLAVQPPVQAPACVLQQLTDGKPDGVNGALVAASHYTDLGDTRRLLKERRVELPMLVGELRARPAADERLAGLALARAMTYAVSEGATGLLLEPATDGQNAWAIGSEAEKPVQQVARLLGRELASASPLLSLADSEGISSGGDAQVCYKSFMRGGEGIVVLWNNTAAPKDISIEFRFQPVVAQRLIFSYQGEFAQRHWDPIMQFSEEAFKRGRPAVYVRLDPLQVQVHTYRLQTPGAGWLRKLEFTRPYTKPEPEQPVGPEQRDWWRDMLGGRRP